MPRAISEFLWTGLAILAFVLGILTLLVLIPLEFLHDHFFPLNSHSKGDPNAGED